MDSNIGASDNVMNNDEMFAESTSDVFPLEYEVSQSATDYSDTYIDSFSEGDDLRDREDNTDEWAHTLPVFLDFPKPPPLQYIERNSSHRMPINYYNIFFNPEFIITLKTWTNQNAFEIKRQDENERHPLHDLIKEWKDINATEMYVFIAILFSMGDKECTSFDRYWDEEYNFYPRFFMTKCRFKMIFEILCFHPNNVPQLDESERYDENGHYVFPFVQSFVNYFNQFMERIAYPGRELVLNETYMHERDEGGEQIAFYVLSDSNGVAHRLQICNLADNVDDNVRKDLAIKLMNDFFYRGHCLYMRYPYTTVEFANFLLSKLTFMTASMCGRRRELPIFVPDDRLAKSGDFVYCYSPTGICAVRWKNRFYVYLTLSTEFGHGFTCVTHPRGFGEVLMPTMYATLCKLRKPYKRQENILIEYSPTKSKPVGWEKKIGINILKIMFTNAFLMYESGTSTRCDFKDFRDDVFSKIFRKPEQDEGLSRRFRVLKHVVCKMPKNYNGDVLTMDCSWCLTKYSERTPATVFCSNCNVPLCLECCRPFHLARGAYN